MVGVVPADRKRPALAHALEVCRGGQFGHRRQPLPAFDGTHIATGQVREGLEGFRRSHLEARAVERLVRLRSASTHSTVAHENVDLEVLLLADPEAARQFAECHLGPLAANDPRMSDLRSTLLRYLDMDHSISKVAAAEHISRNTVTYRVRQAFGICGHDIGDPTTKLRVALLVRDWLDTSPASPIRSALADDER